MQLDNIKDFAAKMNSLAEGVSYIPDPFIIDCKDNLKSLCNEIIFGVWGQGLQKPLIKVKGKVFNKKILGDKHTSFSIDVGGEAFDCIYFNKILVKDKKKLIIICEPMLSNFGGKTSMQLKVIKTK